LFFLSGSLSDNIQRSGSAGPRVEAAMQRIAAENDALLRTIVRLSLEKRLGGQQPTDSPPVRGSRLVEWIEAALAPARHLLASSRFERLVSGLTLWN
jgi:hypothetical protein